MEKKARVTGKGIWLTVKGGEVELPDTLQSYVLTFLPVRELALTRRVSRGWNLRGGKAIGEIREWEISSSAVLDQAQEYGRKIESLTFPRLDTPVPGAANNLIGAHASTLMRVRLFCDWTPSILSSMVPCSLLRSLELHVAEYLSREHVATVFLRCRELRSIKIGQAATHHAHIGPSGLWQALAEAELPLLQVCHLYEEPSKEYTLPVLTHSQGLEEVGMMFGVDPSGEIRGAVIQALSALPVLQTLLLWIGDAGPLPHDSLALQFKALESLVLGTGEGPLDSHLPLILAPGLRHLEIRSADVHMTSLRHWYPSLTSLDLTHAAVEGSPFLLIRSSKPAHLDDAGAAEGVEGDQNVGAPWEGAVWDDQLPLPWEKVKTLSCPSSDDHAEVLWTEAKFPSLERLHLQIDNGVTEAGYIQQALRKVPDLPTLALELEGSMMARDWREEDGPSAISHDRLREVHIYRSSLSSMDRHFNVLPAVFRNSRLPQLLRLRISGIPEEVDILSLLASCRSTLEQLFFSDCPRVAVKDETLQAAVSGDGVYFSAMVFVLVEKCPKLDAPSLLRVCPPTVAISVSC